MQFALKYAADGFAVFPVYEPLSANVCSCGKAGCRGKHPRTINGVKDASTDPNIIKGWWTKWPKASIAIATGLKSKLGVIDLDGPEGLESGRSLNLMSTVTALTGNGKQLFYRDENNRLSNTVKTFSAGVDTRGEGGYVVVPPSIHPNGKKYSWMKASLSRIVLTALPEHFFAQTKTVIAAVNGPKPEGWITTALKEMRNGNIDNTLVSVCGRLRRDGYSAADALTLLGPHAERAGATTGHLEEKIKNVWQRYEASPKSETSQSTAIGDFLQDITKVEWICAPIIARKSIGFVAGLPETCKTWLMVDLAVESARSSGNWLGLFPTTQEKVLFIDQERFKGETQRRFNAVIAAKGIKPSELGQNLSIKCGTTITLNLEASYQAFRNELLTLRPTVVIVDSFATFHSAQENDRMAIQIVLNRIKALRDEFGCAFIFINHESKGVFQNIADHKDPQALDMVGSVGIIAAAEFCLTVRKIEPGISMVHHTKSTLANASKSFVVNLADVPNGITVKGTI